MNSKTYVDQVVEAWEGEYKKGLLTFWILLALYDAPKHVREIKEFIENEARTNLSVDEKSVYRSVGRLHKLELITSIEVESSSGGPKLKVHSLTSNGRRALSQFYQNNIKRIFQTEEFARRAKGL